MEEKKISFEEQVSVLCRRAAAQGAVLLKNENAVLPLAADDNVAVFGRCQKEYYRSGTGSGGAVNVPLPFSSVRFLTTAIVSEMGYAEGLHRQVLFTIGLVLFGFILMVNILLHRLLRGEEG